jgi:peptidoglycan/LPS O-acetylase OafA/YrhL
VAAIGLTERQSAHLDMIRGLSAAAVVASHVRGLFFVDYLSVVRKTSLLSLLYAVTGLGHQAVMVFFVLSGFFIGGSVLSALSRWSWKKYLVNRLARLYLVLLPALIVTAILDYIAYRGPAGHQYFDHAVRNFTAAPLAGHHSLAIFLGNAGFLQTIAVPAFGSDTPLWSLANEFWYYLLFPALAIAVLGREGTRHRLYAGVAASAIFAFLPPGMRWGFATWLFGVAVYSMPKIKVPGALRWCLHFLTVAAFAAVLLLSRAQRIPAQWSDPAVGLTFASWLCCLVRIESSRTEICFAYQRIARVVSGCSYSVYAVHFPVVLLIRCWCGTQEWQPSAGSLAIWSAVFVVILLAGFLFSRITELHTETVRVKLMTITLEMPRSRVAAADA